MIQMTKQQDFINKVKEGAIRGWEKYKILPSLTIAQASLESGFGTSKLAKEGNNLFGIKGDYKGESITINTKEQKKDGSWITVDAEALKVTFERIPQREELDPDFKEQLVIEYYSK